MRIRLVHISILAASLAAFTFSACHKETSVENPNALNGNFSAIINGVQWVAADSTEGASILDGVINVTGISADNKQLSITLNDTVTGVYALNQTSTSVAAYADLDSSGSYSYTTNQGSDTAQAGGTVTITAIDKVNKTITGVFSLKVFRNLDNRQVIITQGGFYKLSYTSSLPPSSSADTMLALIDGANWAGQSITAEAVGSQLAISGSELNGSQTVSLIMPLNIAPGSYTLNYTGGTYIGLYNPTPTIPLASTSGTLTILQNNSATQQVSGNFQFQATDPLGNGNSPHQISSGYFSVQYIY
jgi:Family of unknown function (DUF6252)